MKGVSGNSFDERKSTDKGLKLTPLTDKITLLVQKTERLVNFVIILDNCRANEFLNNSGDDDKMIVGVTIKKRPANLLHLHCCSRLNSVGICVGMKEE